MGFRTQAQVDRLRPPADKTDAYEFDEECTGLSIRLQGAAKRWVVWYQANGQRRRVTLGAVAGLPLRDARNQATRIVGDARDGKDALVEREAVKAKAADTLGKLIDIYLERRAKPRQRQRTYAEFERYLRKRWAALHDRRLDSITRRDIASRLEEIRVDHGPISANRARTYLGSVFAWAMRQGLTDHNPVLGTEPPAAETPRDRVLTPEELALVWRACGGAGEFGVIVKLLILTAQRREEIAAMAWSELSEDHATLVIPSTRTKNKVMHELALPQQAVALLPKKREGRPFVFGRGRKGGFSGFSRCKARLNAAKLREIPGWTLHDIRRSVVNAYARNRHRPAYRRGDPKPCLGPPSGRGGDVQSGSLSRTEEDRVAALGRLARGRGRGA